ncbi:DUF2163 domain-containing protein [Rhodobacteraceae bacterium RKSG542]|uniref:DUF2163 domain-containing protein n=1 Tax=Pseudovibrio flavus TaxID=2529854 RepID=UPI0012BB8A88|nr:DUF2163 domain-containing protein [Pseudovibrio flavus]MTI17053.1 DUF2163 domain-containing protein [Pseudovibrio flavus]
MRSLPSPLAEHLEQEAQTVAYGWVFTRSDGVTFAFSDHDCPVTFAGQTFEPALGALPSAAQMGPDMAIGSQEVAGVISSLALAEKDLAAGLWDDAQVEVYLFNWQSAESQHVLIRRAVVGEVVRQGETFRAELRGLSQQMDDIKGRVFSHQCSALLGDGQCTVDLSAVPNRYVGQVFEKQSNAVEVVVSNAQEAPANWFASGLLEIIDGEGAGAKLQIASSRLAGGKHLISLWLPSPFELQQGQSAALIAGCDKSWGTCASKFSNTVNFRGFPHMPGNDFALFGPDSISGQNNGSKVVG